MEGCCFPPVPVASYRPAATSRVSCLAFAGSSSSCLPRTSDGLFDVKGSAGSGKDEGSRVLGSCAAVATSWSSRKPSTSGGWARIWHPIDGLGACDEQAQSNTKMKPYLVMCVPQESYGLASARWHCKRPPPCICGILGHSTRNQHSDWESRNSRFLPRRHVMTDLPPAGYDQIQARKKVLTMEEKNTCGNKR